MTNWTSDLIAEIMTERNIDRTTVLKKHRYQTVHGFGYCRCSKCKNSWASYWIWIKIDLKRARIIYRFKQKCTKCSTLLSPIVTSEGLEAMMIFVCDRYIDIINGVKPKGRKKGTNKTKAPHKMDLCEKCGFGDHPCWLPLQTSLEEWYYLRVMFRNGFRMVCSKNHHLPKVWNLFYA